MQQDNVQQLDAKQETRRAYEKPSLAAVHLFADHVLGYCSDDNMCQPDPDKISGN